MDLLNNELQNVKDIWNNHYIRGSRNDTVRGKPNELFYMPEIIGMSIKMHKLIYSIHV